MREFMVCRDCNTIFAKDDAKVRKEYHPEVSTNERSFYEEFLSCPHCGSDDIDNASVCVLCGVPHDEATDLCSICKRRIKDAKNWLVNEIIDELFVGVESEEADARNAVEEVLCE